MSKERELLERALKCWDGDYSQIEMGLVFDVIRDYLANANPSEAGPVAWMKEDEDGDLEFNTRDQFSCGRSGGTPLYLHPVEKNPSGAEPVEFHKAASEEDMKVYRAIADNYHPAPRKEFVRLSEEEIMDLSRDECVDFRWPSSALLFARAIEDALEEKNK